jgi:formate hydrogenlyase regulatory protein HycA
MESEMGATLFGPPDKLRIPNDEGRFENVGQLPDRTQFMAYVTGAFPGGVKYPDPTSDWRTKKRWLAVIHRFDAQGNHIGSESKLGGYDIEGRDVAGQKAWNELEEMYTALTGYQEPKFCDIWVKPFSVEIDGVIHGLFYEHWKDGDFEHECVMLEPRDIMFHPPWDSGAYST